MHVTGKVIETNCESETAVSGKTQLVLSAPQCHKSEQFPGESWCGGQQPSALLTRPRASWLLLLPEAKTTNKLRKLHSVEKVREIYCTLSISCA